MSGYSVKHTDTLISYTHTHAVILIHFLVLVGENKFSTQIGVNGLLNMRKLHEASLLIEDLAQIQHHCREALHSDLWKAIGTTKANSPEQSSLTEGQQAAQPQAQAAEPSAMMQSLMTKREGAYSALFSSLVLYCSRTSILLLVIALV